MITPFERQGTPIISDGDIVLLLSYLRQHTIITESALSDLVGNQLETDDGNRYDAVLQFLESSGYIIESLGQLTLSEKGQNWLIEQAMGSSVEPEDARSSDSLLKPYDVAKLNIETRPMSVYQALRKIEKQEINLNPEFQRAFVWDIVRQSRLIESVLIRIPLPALYLDATDQVRWNVVDGLQRLNTLWRYCREEAFGLTNLQFLTELEGKFFSKLPPKYRVLIEDDTQLLFYNLMPGTPIQAKFTIFSRVNTGGMQLTPQEIRHALSQGEATVLLARLARHPIFLSATQGVVESLRMSDRELILRGLAFMSLGVETYKEFNELDAFLLHAMATLNNKSQIELAQLEREFVESLDKIENVFDRYAFRKFTERNGRRSPLNKALFEAWIVGIRKYPKAQLILRRDQIIDGFIELINSNYPFVRSISSSTGSFSAVMSRFGEIDKLMREIME